MSLIITSSHDTAAIGLENKIDSSYHFRNNYSSGLKIPANSEIAVESVKINRSMLLDIEGPVQSNFWFGQRLTTNASYDESLSYMIPAINTLNKNLSPSDFAEDFLPVIKEAYSLHPEVDSVNGVTMSVRHTSSAVTHPFQGFNYNINQVGASATSAVPPSGTEKLLFGEVDDWNGTTLEAGADDTYVQFQPEDDLGGPISLFQGTLTFDSLPTGNFTVGLSRPILNSYQDDIVFDNMNLWGVNGDRISPGGLGPDLDQFYDYAAEVGEDDVLRLYHVASDPFDRGQPYMKEIIYYQKNPSAVGENNASNSSFATGAPIPKADLTGDLTFTVENERVIISVSGTKLVCAPNAVNASTKDQVPKPVTQTCWKMYPTVGLWEDGDTIDITEYRCRDSTTIFRNKLVNNWNVKAEIHADLDTIYKSPAEGGAVDPTTDLYEPSRPWTNTDGWIDDVEQRPLVLRATDSEGALADPSDGSNITRYMSTFVRPYKGLNASTMDDYEPIFICGNAKKYLQRVNQQWQPNNAEVLGFSPFSIGPLESSITPASGTASFVSTTRPHMTSEQSTYIRVPTLNHKTHNFGTGNPSKILFQVPRFDNSGTETGALYFQNNDKTFVDLNNITDFTITDLDVSFVRKNETFARDLSGSSEVVFVIRPKKM